MHSQEFEVRDPRFRHLIQPNALLQKLTSDCLWAEGPVYFPAMDLLLWSDIPGSPSDLSEEFSRQRMHDAGVVLTATNTLVAEIAQDWSTPAGQQLITLLLTDVFPALGAGIA